MVAKFNSIWNRTESCKIITILHVSSGEDLKGSDRDGFLSLQGSQETEQDLGYGCGTWDSEHRFCRKLAFFSSAAYGKSYFLCTRGQASCKERLQLHTLLGPLCREQEGWISWPRPVVLKRLWQACWLGLGGAERFKPFSLRGNRTQFKIRFKFLFCCWFLSSSEGKKCLQQRICLMRGF